MKRLLAGRTLALVGSTLAVALVAGSPTSQADTDPPLGTVPTVSADGLPTVQVDGVVWDQVTVGTTVYATGEFRTARPAGAPLGTSEVPRRNILAFDLTTGDLLPFHHTLNGPGFALSVSPDHKRLYVGGDFTRVDGAKHRRVAAFSVASGALVRSFKGGVTNTVRALAAANDQVYVGGAFRHSISGAERIGLASFTLRGRDTRWAPKANNSVRALLLSPNGRKIVIGGNFSRINARRYYGFAAVDRLTGKPDKRWLSHSKTYPLRNFGPNAGITSLSTDGSRIYLTGYQLNRYPGPGRFEGRAAVRARDGKLVWMADCHGDSYDSIPIGPVLYSVGHAHDCQPAGYFPDQGSRPKRALAETIAATHTNGPATNGYASFEGLPAPTQLDWYPSFTAGTVSGRAQAAWSITGNADYISLGGEFPTVNGVAQQGLVRFAVTAHAPNEVGPQPYTGYGLTAPAADQNGDVAVSWAETWDKDNAVLTYTLTRDGVPTPVCTVQAESRFWALDPMGCTDTGLTPGDTPRYHLTVTDVFGNAVTTSSTP